MLGSHLRIIVHALTTTSSFTKQALFRLETWKQSKFERGKQKAETNGKASTKSAPMMMAQITYMFQQQLDDNIDALVELQQPSVPLESEKKYYQCR